ncbi:MAG: SusC/RagA family TonB-linked outer membrane protein, partial [Bacteroidales bacterium]|nr:SusC/RagA family TonB-linked outer membrane protein [Bacteroidales bacterium]
MKKLTIFLAFLLFAGFNAVAQMQIAGTVTSAEDGLPIPGVSVVVKGNSSIGISTDIDGKYTLTVPKSAVSLVFTSVGMKTVEEDINNRTIVDVKMKPDILGIDEVMVVAYGTAKKASFTGAAKTVSSEELSSVKVESIDKALAGKVSGVRVSSKTGAPGSSGDIQIRGIGSITGSTSPLYIVDGVAITTGNFGHSAASSNVLSSINPEDIESTTVLKDAAAASLYGSRAANGVVIITTKKGKSGEAKFNFKANYGISGIATNSFQHMGGIAYYDYMHKALENFYYFNENALFTDKTPALEKAAKNYADENIWVKRQNGANWRDEIYGQGTDKDYQLSVSGGGENNQYYISAGYKDIKGIVLNTDFKRYSSIINVNSKPRKWLDLSAGAQLAHTEQNGVRDQATLMQQGLGSSSPLSLIFQSRPGQNVHNEDGTYNQKAGFGKIKNAVEKLKDGDQFVNTKSNRALINASGTIKFTDGLKFTSTNSAEYIGNETLEYWGPNSIGGSAMNGYGQRNQRRVITLTSSNILNYTKTFNEDHNISALAGFEVQDFEYLKVYTGVTDYSSPKLMELSAGKPHRAMSEIINDYLQSFLGNLDYNYANRYYLKASIRQDQSSKLGVDNRKGIFWSASASWRLTEEDFIDISFLNDAKVRFSYGTNGNLPNYSYSHLGLYDLSSVYGPFSATYLSQLGNKNLGWEKSNNMNVGLDISIFDKISFTVEYFHKRTKDLLLDMPVSYATGVSEIISNAGEISNKGIDMELHLVDILSSELKWNADLAFSTLTAKVEKLPG